MSLEEGYSRSNPDAAFSGRWLIDCPDCEGEAVTPDDNECPRCEGEGYIEEPVTAESTILPDVSPEGC